MVGVNWLEKAHVQKWLQENPSVTTWLDLSERPQTRNSQGNYLYKFCEGVNASPEELKRLRFTTEKSLLAQFRKEHNLPVNPLPANVDGAFVILDLLHDFIRHGTLLDTSRHRKGRKIEITKLSKNRRGGYYYTVRSYFKSFRGGLPEDSTFKITETSRVKREEFDKEGDRGIQELNRIILAAKEPYRTIFSTAKYGMLGRSEMVQLSQFWPQIYSDLQAGKNEIKIDFTYRKSNDQPYYTFLPAKIFSNFRDQKANPFVTRSGKPITINDLNRVWVLCRRRAGITKPVTEHDIRDLMRTTGTKAGAEASCVQLMMGHTVDPLRYNQIYGAPTFVKAEWEKLRMFIDGETQAWKKDVEELREKLDKTDMQRRDDRRLANRQFLLTLRYSKRAIKRIEDEHGGDLANLTKQDIRGLGERAAPRFQTRNEPNKPPPRKIVAPEQAELLMEQGWDLAPRYELPSGKWLLEWLHTTPPPKPHPQAPSTLQVSREKPK